MKPQGIGIVILATVLVVIVGVGVPTGIGMRSRQAQLMEENRRLRDDISGLEESSAQAQEEMEILSGSDGHFSLAPGWVDTGHVVALKAGLVSTCLECHPPSDCSRCHSLSGDGSHPASDTAH